MKTGDFWLVFVAVTLNNIACTQNDLNGGIPPHDSVNAIVQETQVGDIAMDIFIADSGRGAKDVFFSFDNKTAETAFLFFDECPTGGECNEIYWFPSVCLKSNEPEKSGYISICTVPCELDESGMHVYSGNQLVDADCETWLQNSVGVNCCGLVKNPFTQGLGHYCLPVADGYSCCYNSVSCLGKCCSDGIYECSECGCLADDGICPNKCVQPKPIICGQECCPDNYDCVCEEEGGFCLPGGSEMCDCDDMNWCEPSQECIKNGVCYQTGKICKPLGAEDCPKAEDCYCVPGQICTHESPACCASDEPVPCGDYCCPDKNECLTDIKDCLPPGWDYCEQWGTKCGVGLDCKGKEIGCKNDYEEECDYGGIICSATENCVGEGKGVNGCCPTNQEVPCDGYCCPTGTHCESGCGGCVEEGKKCCPDGQTQCLDAKICWAGGSGCLDAIEQDCGSYYCDPNYVCSSGPQKCCPASNPQTCGGICCQKYDTCYEAGSGGYCVNEQAGEEYCGGSFKCENNLQCMKGEKACMPNNSVQCCVSSEQEYCALVEAGAPLTAKWSNCYCPGSFQCEYKYKEKKYYCITSEASFCSFADYFCPDGYDCLDGGGCGIYKVICNPVCCIKGVGSNGCCGCNYGDETDPVSLDYATPATCI